MSYQLGAVALDGAGNRWRVVEQRPHDQQWIGRAVINGASTVRQLGTVGIVSVEAALVYDVDDDVTVEGVPGVVVDRWGPGLEVSPYEPTTVFYAVRIRRTPSAFASVADDVRQLHAFSIDP